MTWNFIAGCEKVSQGCKSCYAIGEAWRMAHNPNPKLNSVYSPTVKKDGTSINWTGKITLIPERLEKPFSISKPKKIFVNSMSDLFHDDVPFDLIDKFLAVVALTPHHTYQVLTKRPNRMQEYFSSKNLYDRVLAAGNEFRCKFAWLFAIPISNPVKFPFTNLHLGFSAENQAAFDDRVSWLMRTPAAIRFVSCEPLLGYINFYSEDRYGQYGYLTGTGVDSRSPCQSIPNVFGNKIDWVIVGGESGRAARPMDEDWARAIIRQCEDAQVPVFYKQKIEGKKKISLPLLDGRQYAQLPAMEVAG